MTDRWYIDYWVGDVVSEGYHKVQIFCASAEIILKMELVHSIRNILRLSELGKIHHFDPPLSPPLVKKVSIKYYGCDKQCNDCFNRILSISLAVLLECIGIVCQFSKLVFGNL